MPGKQSNQQSVCLTEIDQTVDTKGICNRCGLWNRSASSAYKQFASYGSETPTILVVMSRIDPEDMIVGFVCGDTEVREHILAEIGRVLGVEDPTQVVRFSALTRCPSGAKKISAEHFKHCSDILALEVARFKPRIVLGIGGTAGSDVHAALGLPSRTRGFAQELPKQLPLRSPLTGQTKQYAASVESNDFPCHVMKTSAISWALREPFVFKEIAHDFSKLPKIIAGTYPVKDTFAGRNYNVVNDADYAVQILGYFAGLDRFSFDIETGPAPYGLDTYSNHSKILGVGFADVNRNAYFIPLHHKDCPYPDKLHIVLDAMKRCLQSPAEKSAHNGCFDAMWFPVKYDWEVVNFHFDTQLAHGLIDENLKHALKYLAEMDTDLGYYDDEMLDGFRDSKGKKVAALNRCYERHISLEVLGNYCCADADATEQLRLKYEVDLETIGLLDYFYKMTMPDARSVIDTQLEGVAIDSKQRETMLQEFSTKLVEAQKPVYESRAHKTWMAEESKLKKGAGKFLLDDEGFVYRDYEHFQHYRDQPLAWFPLSEDDDRTPKEYMDGAFQELRMAKAMLKSKLKLGKGKTYKLSALQLNIQSPTQLQRFLYGKRFCGLHPVKETPEGGASTDKESMEKLKDQDPVCQAIVDVRTWQKNLSTYCLPFVQGPYEYVNSKGQKKTGMGYIRDDGICHPSFIMSGNDRGQGGQKEKGKGTRTGRKSAVEPPIQVMKTRGEGSKPIKKLFITKHIGGMLMSWDFSQLELRLFGIVAGIAWIIQRYIRGADLHLELAMEIFNKTEEECLANNKAFRGHAKEFWFGPLYGEGAKAIVAALAKKGFHITEEEAQEILDRMLSRMPEYRVFEAGVEQELRDTCSIRTVTGRRRWLPTYLSREKYIVAKTKRQAVNCKIQSPGSDMTTIAWFMLNNWAKQMKFRSRIAITVHDSLIWDCLPGEAPIIAVATRYMMEHVPFKFLEGSPVPIIADGEAGVSWGTMVDLTKPVKHEDVDFVGSDLRPYVGTEAVPMEHWQNALFDHSHMDPIKECCAQHNYI